MYYAFRRKELDHKEFITIVNLYNLYIELKSIFNKGDEISDDDPCFRLVIH